jgi:hypothetical protein
VAGKNFQEHNTKNFLHLKSQWPPRQFRESYFTAPVDSEPFAATANRRISPTNAGFESGCLGIPVAQQFVTPHLLEVAGFN